jgi:hypothetical protein
MTPARKDPPWPGGGLRVLALVASRAWIASYGKIMNGNRREKYIMVTYGSHKLFMERPD